MSVVKFFSDVGHLTADATNNVQITLGAAIDASYLTASEAGVADQDKVRYRIDKSNLDFEVGFGLYTASGTKLDRTTIIVSKIGGTAGTTRLTLDGTGQVKFTAAGSDYGWDGVNDQASSITCAATTDVFNIYGSSAHVTGSTGPVTNLGTASKAGLLRLVIFDSTPTITASSAIVLPNAATSLTVTASSPYFAYANTTTQIYLMSANIATGVSPAFTVYRFDATAGQTVFTGADLGSNTLMYTVGSLLALRNGNIIDSSDITATNGSSVTFGTACALNDRITFIAYAQVGLAAYNTVQQWSKAATTDGQTAFTGADDAVTPVTLVTNGQWTAVHVGGNYVPPTDYTLTSTTVTLNSGVPIGTVVSVMTVNTNNVTGTTQAQGTNDTTMASTAFANLAAGIQGTSNGDSAYVIPATDRFSYTSAAFTAPRTWTLPAANALPKGAVVTVADVAGGVTSTNTLTVARAGSDTIDGSATSFVITVAYGFVSLKTDGTSKWQIVAGVTSNAYTAALSGDTTIVNINTFYDGPSISQPTVGTYLVSGQILVKDVTGAAVFIAKLHDGSTVFASVRLAQETATDPTPICFTNTLVSAPAGNLKISCENTTRGGSASSILASNSSLGKDSYITAVRIA